MNMQNKKLLLQGERELTPGVLYAIIDETEERTGEYGDTPDGVGMYWYESAEQASEDYDLETALILEVTEERMACIREGIGLCKECDQPNEDLDREDGVCVDCEEASL